MDLSKIPAGRAPPWDITVVVEIPMQGDAGAPGHPGNYGFVPKTLMPDGEPCQALVVGSVAVLPGALLRSRPIGVLGLIGKDGVEATRLLAGPRERLHPFFAHTTSYRSLPSPLLDQVVDFFVNVEDAGCVGEAGCRRSIRVTRWGDAEEAAQLVLEAMERHRYEQRGRTDRAG